MGDGRIFLKTSATLPLIKIYRMSLLSAEYISLDSTLSDISDPVPYMHCVDIVINQLTFHPIQYRCYKMHNTVFCQRLLSTVPEKKTTNMFEPEEMKKCFALTLR
jgi:hypothetical protein